MMHRCSNSSSPPMAPCSCDFFQNAQASHHHSFSVLLSMQSGAVFEDPYLSPSSVDCTLSLGTPSTRMSEDHHCTGSNRRVRASNNSGYVSGFGWDLVHGNGKTTPYNGAQYQGRCNSNVKASRGSTGSDPLLARRCANCDTTSTPLWRNGPRGPKSLCNACGIRFKKEERRATAVNSTPGGGASGSVPTEPHSSTNYSGTSAVPSWVHHAQPQRASCYSPNEFRFMDDVSDRENDASAINFLSWRLNVADRPSLVNEFTRY